MSVGSLHSIKRLSKSRARRFLREQEERVTKPSPQPISETDRELRLLMTREKYVKRLTKATRRK